MVVAVTKDKKISDIIDYIKKGEDILVLDNKGKYFGVISNDKIIKYLYRPDTTIEKITLRIKPLGDYNILDIIEKMILSNTRIVPVKKDDKIEIVNIFEVLESIKEDKEIINKLSINNLVNRNIYFVYDKDDVSKAIGLMKSKGVSRLIVLSSKDNTPIGIISLSDIIRYFVFEKERNSGSFEEKDLEIEVRSIISNKLIYVNSTDSLLKVIETLVNNRIFSVPVLENYKIYGIITAKDILISYLQLKKEKQYNLVIHGIDLDEIDIKYIRKKYEGLIKKYSKILGDDIRLVLHIKKVNESIEDRIIRFIIKARLWSSKVNINVSYDGIELYSTINNIFYLLYEELEKIKHKNERNYMIQRIYKDDIFRYI